MTWRDKGSGAYLDGYFFNPALPSKSFFWIGGVALQDPNQGCVTVVKISASNPKNAPKLLVPPLDWKLVWKDTDSGARQDGAFWTAVPPSKDFTCLGSIAQLGYKKPNVPNYRCVHKYFVQKVSSSTIIWTDEGSDAFEEVTVLKLPNTGSFIAVKGREKSIDWFDLKVDPSVNPDPRIVELVLDSYRQKNSKEKNIKGVKISAAKRKRKAEAAKKKHRASQAKLASERKHRATPAKSAAEKRHRDSQVAAAVRKKQEEIISVKDAGGAKHFIKDFRGFVSKNPEDFDSFKMAGLFGPAQNVVSKNQYDSKKKTFQKLVIFANSNSRYRAYRVNRQTKRRQVIEAKRKTVTYNIKQLIVLLRQKVSADPLAPIASKIIRIVGVYEKPFKGKTLDNLNKILAGLSSEVRAVGIEPPVGNSSIAKAAAEKKRRVLAAARAKAAAEKQRRSLEAAQAKAAAEKQRQSLEAAQAKAAAEKQRRVSLIALTLPGQVTAAEKQDRYGVAVIIGNKNYQNHVPEVAYAHNDAAAFKQYVTSVLGFREGNVIDLRDATMAQLVSTFGKKGNHKGTLHDYVRPGKSRVVVFYSGHGVPGIQAKKGYLLPVDAHPDKAELNGYLIDLLYENLGQIESKSTTVFLDACFSGESPRGMLIKSASPVFTRIQAPSLHKGLTVLTAASGQQLASWDDDAQHGLFTHYVLRGLYGKADDKSIGGNGDGKVSVGELQTWLDEEMTYQARRRFSREQKASVSGDAALILASISPNMKFEPVNVPQNPVAQDKKEPEDKADFTVTEVDTHLFAKKTSNLRAGPGTEHQKMGSLQAGEEVNVTGKVEGRNWYRIERSGGKHAFIFAPLLADQAPDTGNRQQAFVPQPRTGGGETYGIVPVQIRGKTMREPTRIIQMALQNLPGVRILEGAAARSANTIISGAVTRMRANKEANPEYAGAKIASGFLSLLGGAALGELATANTPPSYNVFDIEVVLRAKRRAGETVSARGVYFERKDGRKPTREEMTTGLRQAFRQAAERLATRLAGAVPPPLREPHQIRRSWQLDSIERNRSSSTQNENSD